MIRSRSGQLYDVMVGLEFHVALRVRSKLLSGSAACAPPSSAPNTHVSLFDAAHPGTLPHLNAAAVEQGLRAALCLHAAIPRLSSFQRKHYFYADLPHGFQVTQLDAPLAVGGFLPFRLPLRGGSSGPQRHHPFGVARIARLQLEVDSGKSNHTLLPGASAVDLNRAGTALLEVVTEPDVRGGEEAGALVAAMQAALVHAGVTEGAMELGQLRVDVNVSVRRAAPPPPSPPPPPAPPPALHLLQALEGAYAYGSLRSMAPHTADCAVLPRCEGRGWAWRFARPEAAAAALGRHASAQAADPLPAPQLTLPALPHLLHPSTLGFGARVEIKNLNSVRAVGRAVEGEALRQCDILERGGSVDSETRAAAGSAAMTALRSKAGAQDYRFMPEPDIEPILVPAAVLQGLRAAAPRDLFGIYLALAGEYGLRGEDAAFLADHARLLGAFYSALRAACMGMQAQAAAAGGGAAAGQVWVDAANAVAGAAAPAAAAAHASSPPFPPSAQPLAAAVCHWLCSEALGGVGDGEGVGVFLARVGAGAPACLGALVALVQAGVISGKSGKAVWGVCVERLCGGGDSGGSVNPREIAREMDLFLLKDADVLAGLAARVCAEPALAGARAKWEAGSARALGAFVAALLEASEGRACPEAASEALVRMLGPAGGAGGEGAGLGAVGGRKEARRSAAAAAALAKQQRGL